MHDLMFAYLKHLDYVIACHTRNRIFGAFFQEIHNLHLQYYTTEKIIQSNIYFYVHTEAELLIITTKLGR